ncbi:MAG: GTPase Era [Gammaproteobacteria bacterium]|nr:MAG: GTPase Era [Gammaproteobacteria bacterium]
MSDSGASRCGYIAIVGRPNVGKSTLLNRILGQKLSITSSKRQTTRHQILGIKTENNVQSIYVDTPGMHHGSKRAMNRYMNKAATAVLYDVDVIVLVVEGLRWDDEDDYALGKVATLDKPVILAVNKVDLIREKESLLPHLDKLAGKADFNEVIPLSSKTGINTDVLEQKIAGLLPKGEYQYQEGQITDRSERFFAAEIIREKLMRRLGQEIPYALTVEIEKFEIKGGTTHINAVVWVEKGSQKKIVIGKSGEGMKEVGRQARLDMQKMFDCKVYLEIWVKVREGWSDDVRALKSFGYEN